MKTVLLVSHVSTVHGPPNKFYKYLKDKYKVYAIFHPMAPKDNQKSVICNGKKEFMFKIPPAIQYPSEGIYGLILWYKHFKLPPKIDLAICFDSLAYFHTYLSKIFLRIDKIAYYNVDYSKKRFSNVFMNAIYQYITKFSYVTCDYFFAFSNKFVEEVDPTGKYAYKHFAIKPTIDLKSIKRNIKKYPYSLVYAGSIDYGTINFSQLLEALSRLKKENISFILDIYGKTDTQSTIRNKIRALNLDDRIFFRGVLDNYILTSAILAKYTIGIASYATTSDAHTPDHSFMNKGLTGKLVDYIGAGLPIISTRINDSFLLIDKNKIGFSVIDADDWYKSIKTLFFDKSLYKIYSKNALRFAKNYDTDKLLEPVFRKILLKTRSIACLQKNH